MGFGLKLRKLDKQEIDRRVREAAKILGLEDFLDRKPKALSGGQRQRVAMGRAIVREPKAFLMDEPLSNLDAKLRVQMRSEIARIQHDSQRHDALRHPRPGRGDDDGRSCRRDPQGRPPAGRLATVPLRPPREPVRCRLHRLARDEHGRGRPWRRTNGTWTIEFGGFSPGVPDEVFAARPALQAFESKQVVIGYPPGGHGGRLARSPTRRRTAGSARSVILREALGADVLVHFSVRRRPVMTEDTKELAHDVGAEALEAVERAGDQGESELPRPPQPEDAGGAGEGDRARRGHEPVALLRPRDGARGSTTENRPPSEPRRSDG